MKKAFCLLLVLLLTCFLTGCGEDETFSLEDGDCIISLTTEIAANYEWYISYAQEGIVECIKTSNTGSGYDVSGYSSTDHFHFSGLQEGSTDVYFSYRQLYQDGSFSAFTRFYELTVDENGDIVNCLQRGDTMTSGGHLCAFLKCDTGNGYTWRVSQWDKEYLNVSMIGAETDTDKSLTGIVWQVFSMANKKEGITDVSFELLDPDGNVVHTVTYEIHIAADGTTTCTFPDIYSQSSAA